MKIRLMLVALMTAIVTLLMVGQAWACRNTCPPGQNCIQVCMPELW